MELGLTSQWVYSERGASRRCAGDFTGAVEDLDRALQMKSDSSFAWAQRGAAKRALGDLEGAIADFNEWLRIAPQYRWALTSRAATFKESGRLNEAVDDYLEVAQRHPDTGIGYNEAAWILAAHPNDDVRNGARAVDLARKACEFSQWQDAIHLDTLAAAYAEVGDFAAAIRTQEKAIEHASQDNLAEHEDHLKSFQRKQPLRES